MSHRSVRGRRPPPPLTANLSTAGIVEALKDIEKNPFSMNTSVPNINGEALLDSKKLRVAGSLQRTLNMSRSNGSFANEMSSSGNTRSIAGYKVTATSRQPLERTIPLDSYSHSVDSTKCQPLPDKKTSQMKPRHKENVIDRYMESDTHLSNQKLQTCAALHEIKRKEEVLFLKTAEFVPPHMLIKHGMFDMIKGKQLNKIMKLLLRMKRQLLSQGFALWHKHAQILSTALFGEAAVTVHRVARGFLGRRRVKRLYQALLKREKMKNKQNAVAMMNRSFKVTMIQSCYRRYRAVLIVQKERKHKKSIITVQKFYKKWRYKDVAKRTFQDIIRKHFSCKKIQRVWRGAQGRKMAKHERVLRHRTQRQERYETPEGVFQLYFEQQGAAIRIQKWYNSLHFVEENKERAREAKRQKYLNILIVKIQRIVRLFLMNRRALSKHRARRLKLKYNLKPRQLNRLILAQSVVRRYLARKRTHDLFAELLAKRRKRERAKELGIVYYPRKTNKYEHLKIGNLRNIARLERKAAIIQKWYKSIRILNFFYGMIRNRRQLIADKIRCWFRTWRYRRQLKSSLFLIQPYWRKAVQKFLVRKYAQISISRKYKTYRAMKWFREWQRKKNLMASMIQNMVRHYFRKLVLKTNIARARYENEMLCSGEQLYTKTCIYDYIDELNRRIQRTKAPIPKFELQLLFMVYFPNAQLDVAKGSKLIKECPGLATPPQLTLKELELIFAKVRGAANGASLDYFQFLQYLFYIACVKYLSVDASTLPMASKINHNTESRKERIKLELSLKNRSLVESFKFGRLHGRKALITQLVYDYISKNPAYKTKENSLEEKSAVKTSQRNVDAALNSIQRMFKVIIMRLGMYKVRQVVQARKLQEKRNASTTVIQSYCRRYLGRRRAVRLSQKMYLKYIDNDSGIPFWTNSHTGTSFWSKPPLLRELDCGDGIKLPLEREQYTPQCCECNDNTAACFCEQCNALYCNKCFSSMHTSGNRKLHDRITLEMCVECTFQVPTKRCLTCDELYCDTCFRFVHRRGRARLHTFSWVTANCYYCEERAAHWRRIDSSKGFDEELICTVDFWDTFGCDPKTFVDPTGQHAVYPVAYTGPSVLAWRKARDEAIAEELKREAYRKQQEELAERRRQKAVITIQRTYRGVLVRRNIEDFIRQRKDFFRLREKEFPQREVWQYQLAAKYGRAKALDYDTNKEKILRKYPFSMHEVVAHCIERKWGVMCELLKPVDLGDLAPENLDFKNRVKAYLGLQQALFSLYLAKSNVQSREKAHVRSRERYRLARSSTTAREKQKKALQLAANKASKRVDRAKAKLADVQDSLTFARHKYEYFTGPQGLQNLVKDRIRSGVPMPFTVDLVYKSRYAVVRYDKPSTNATVSDNLFVPKPGKWRCKIKIGSIIKIQGMHFQVVEDVEDMIDIREQLEIELKAEEEAEKARVAAEEQKEKERLRRERLRKTGGVYERLDTADDPSVSIRSGGGSLRSGGGSLRSVGEVAKQKQKLSQLEEADIPFVTELTCITTEEDEKFARTDRKEFEESFMTERIKLDRPWLFADMTYQDIYLVTVKPPLQRKIFNACRSLHKNSLVQSFTAFNVLMLHKRSKFWMEFSKNFDDESSAGAFFIRLGQGAERKRNKNMKVCRSQVNLDYEYRIKERLSYGFKVAFEVPKGMIKRKYERYKLEKEYKKLSPYRRWEKSEDKTEIKVVVESDMGDIQTLGFMMMDTDAPLDVAREYIHRNFRMELNEICGSSFQFFAKNKDGSGDVVPIVAEDEKWSSNYLKESKSEGSDEMHKTFYLSAIGGEHDIIDEGNFSDDDIMAGDDGSLDDF